MDARFDLAGDGRAPGQARGNVRQILALWQLPALVDSVTLAVSELVTNAVRHGRPPLFLLLRREKDHVRLAVHDASATEPAAHGATADQDAENGRGLDIVSALAADMGCEQIPGDGKMMYASFNTPGTSDPA